MRKIYITEAQLEELIDKNLMFSSDNTPEYEASQVSTTEPVGDENYGDPMNADDRGREMQPSIFQRMTKSGTYGGPRV